MQPLKDSDPTKLGPYRLMGRLGAGGMGQVYLGVSPLAERVAVKVIKADHVDDSQVQERFEIEVENLRRVQGPRVARFEGSGWHSGLRWLATEFVPGRTLDQHVRKVEVMSDGVVATLGWMLGEGLRAIHREGLLHRDLKPNNVLLGPDGPKIIDLGLAVLAGRNGELTKTGDTPGTVPYMAPEQARGEKQLTTAVDVYALAATLVFAATGQWLYPRARGFQLWACITDDKTMPDLAGVPDNLVPLFTDMLGNNAAARPRLDDVVDALLDIAQSPGYTINQVRAELVRITTDEITAVPAIPADLADPEADDSDDSDPARSLIAVSPPTIGTQHEIDWLVDWVRHRYDREPSL